MITTVYRDQFGGEYDTEAEAKEGEKREAVRRHLERWMNAIVGTAESRRAAEFIVEHRLDLIPILTTLELPTA